MPINLNRDPTFGIALGGGAVLGIAHLGVLHALAEEGLKPSHLSGTSIGAIIAALYAFGKTPEEISKALSKLDWWKLSSFKLSKHGIMENSAMYDFVHHHIGDKQFADAEIPLSFMATDLIKRSRRVLESGDIAKAAQISACVPGIYSPVQFEDTLLVDGGLVENVPISPLKKQNLDFILAINLNGSTRDRVPEGIFDVLATSLDLAIDSHTLTQLKEADFVLSLDLADFSRTDATQADALFREGYEACRKEIHNIKKAVKDKAPDLFSLLAERVKSLIE